MRRTLMTIVLPLLVAASGAARADGAFPDSMQLLLPPDRPHEILVGTNFGLLVSEDDGATWSWVCEQVLGACARLYQINAPPSDTVLAVTGDGLMRVTDSGCGQSLARVAAATRVTDAFADPTRSQHVLAIGASPLDGGGTGFGLYESADAGASFGAARYLAPADVTLTGVENARAAPDTIYLSGMAGLSPSRPLILRSTDGGASFQSFDHAGSLGEGTVAIAAVDPEDPRKLYLRAISSTGTVNRLAISEDGGQTSVVRLTLPDYHFMSAFLKRADGTILVAGLNTGSNMACSSPMFTGDGVAYLSTDGGETFSPWAGAPHVRALGERDGVLYAVGSNYTDGFALASTTDMGAHWTPLLDFARIRGPLPCVSAACAGAWASLMDMFGIGMTAGPVDDTPPPSGGCALCPGRPRPTWPLGSGLVALVAALGMRSRRRRGCAAGPRDAW